MTTDDLQRDHWLWRLTANAWLQAAATELAAGSLHVQQRRTAITHARRAAGMALNAVLTRLPEAEQPTTRWGRSYLDHLRALADGHFAPLPAEVTDLAAQLLQIDVVPGARGLVQLGPTPTTAATRALALAQALVDHCRHTIAGLG